MLLQALTVIHIPTKTGASQRPDEVLLQVKDGAEAIEARDVDDLAALLRLKYPDGAFERFLRSERDREADVVEAEAVDRLIAKRSRT